MNITVHGFNQAFGNDQTQARAAILAGNAGVCLREGLKQPRLFGIAHTYPSVFNIKLQVYPRTDFTDRIHPHTDTARGCEFHRVSNQVGQNLFKAQPVAE